MSQMEKRMNPKKIVHTDDLRCTSCTKFHTVAKLWLVCSGLVFIISPAGAGAADPNAPVPQNPVSPNEPNNTAYYVTPDMNAIPVKVTSEDPNNADTGAPREPGDLQKTIKQQRFRKLWESKIAAPNDAESEAGKQELQKLISTIRSIDIHVGGESYPEPEHIEAPATQEPTQTSEPDEVDELFQLPKVKKIRLRDYEPVADGTVADLQKAMKKMHAVANSFELAEVLFISGRNQEAAQLYEHAMNLVDPNSPTADAEKTWILLQIANCKRRYDPAGSLQAYKQLVAQYPKSSWTPLARANIQLLNWLDRDDPGKLLQDCRIQIKEVQAVTKKNYGNFSQ